MPKRQTTLRPNRSFWLAKTLAEENQISIFLNEIKPFIAIRQQRGNAALTQEYAQASGEKKRQLLEIITLGNAMLVIKIAYGYIGFGVPLMDLIQEGLLGLRTAVEHYRAEKGATVATYASYWINQAIRRAIINTTDILPYRVPTHMMEKAILIRGIINRHREKLGCWPTIDEIMNDLRDQNTQVASNISAEKIIQLLSPILGGKQSLNASNQSVNDDIFTLNEIIPTRECYSDPENMVATRELRDKALADKINLSRERVRQIETKALRRLKIRTKMNKKEIVRLHRQIEELEKIILS